MKSIGQLQFPRDEENLAEYLQKAKASGDSYGGIVELRVESPPPFLGQPVFAKLKSEMTSALMNINACCGVELGSGFFLAQQKGSQRSILNLKAKFTEEFEVESQQVKIFCFVWLLSPPLA